MSSLYLYNKNNNMLYNRMSFFYSSYTIEISYDTIIQYDPKKNIRMRSNEYRIDIDNIDLGLEYLRSMSQITSRYIPDNYFKYYFMKNEYDDDDLNNIRNIIKLNKSLDLLLIPNDNNTIKIANNIIKLLPRAIVCTNVYNNIYDQFKIMIDFTLYKLSNSTIFNNNKNFENFYNKIFNKYMDYHSILEKIFIIEFYINLRSVLTKTIKGIKNELLYSICN